MTGVATGQPQPFGREPIQLRRAHVVRAVATEVTIAQIADMAYAWIWGQDVPADPDEAVE